MACMELWTRLRILQLDKSNPILYFLTYNYDTQNYFILVFKYHKILSDFQDSKNLNPESRSNLTYVQLKKSYISRFRSIPFCIWPKDHTKYVCVLWGTRYHYHCYLALSLVFFMVDRILSILMANGIQVKNRSRLSLRNSNGRSLCAYEFGIFI